MLIVTVGLPGSGKSTWAAANLRTVVSPDTIRIQEFGTAFDRAIEARVWRRARSRTRRALVAGDVVCFDATSATRKRRAALVQLARQHRVPAIAVWLRIPPEIAWERNVARERKVPEMAFAQLVRALTPPSLDEGFALIRVIEAWPYGWEPMPAPVSPAPPASAAGTFADPRRSR